MGVVDFVAFSRVNADVESLKREVETGRKVFLQAPQRFQSLVDEFIQGLMPEDTFLREISQRTGFERPRDLWWVEVAFHCRFHNVPVTMLEPDMDEVLEEAAGELNLQGPGRESVVQEARLWFLSGTGYPKHFYRAFNSLFSWLPFHVGLRRRFLAACAWAVNLWPGDQQDVLFLVAKANGLLAMELARRLEDAEGVAFLDEDIAAEVERLRAEL